MAKRITELAEKDRPREKLQEKGAEALSDIELLAILLGSGTQKHDVLMVSKKVIKIIDEKGVCLSVKDLMGIEGIGTAKATALTAAFEFVRRRIKPEGLKIKSPADILPIIQHYSDRKQEHFLSISINGANEVMNVRVVTIGLVNQSQAHPREIFSDVLMDRASSLIIAHNHPSGNLQPSKEDIDITHKIFEAGRTLGIKLMDHIIFSKKGYYSFLENKRLN
jgi:DNA repair protein RadC